MISTMAFRTSLESAPSGATENSFEKSGSVSISKIKSTAMVYVLKFFLAISSIAASYRLLSGSSFHTTHSTPTQNIH